MKICANTLFTLQLYSAQLYYLLCLMVLTLISILQVTTAKKQLRIHISTVSNLLFCTSSIDYHISVNYIQYKSYTWCKWTYSTKLLAYVFCILTDLNISLWDLDGSTCPSLKVPLNKALNTNCCGRAVQWPVDQTVVLLTVQVYECDQGVPKKEEIAL